MGRFDTPHNGGSTYPLTFSRMGDGLAMTADYRPSLIRAFKRHLRVVQMRPVSAFVVPPGGGTTIRGPVSGPVTFKARTEDTAGTFLALETTVAPKQGPPLHVHGREDEMWYVLEGNFRFKADDEILQAPTGSFVFVPRGTAHCFQNIGDTPAQILVMFTPGGMERFFEEHAKLPDGPVDPETYSAIARSCWMEVAGPPLADSDPL